MFKYLSELGNVRYSCIYWLISIALYGLLIHISSVEQLRDMDLPGEWYQVFAGGPLLNIEGQHGEEGRRYRRIVLENREGKSEVDKLIEFLGRAPASVAFANSS
jgi:hypothetical protein